MLDHIWQTLKSGNAISADDLALIHTEHKTGNPSVWAHHEAVRIGYCAGMSDAKIKAAIKAADALIRWSGANVDARAFTDALAASCKRKPRVAGAFKPDAAKVAYARDAKERARAEYRDAREWMDVDPMRRQIGGLSPSCWRAAAAQRAYHEACAALKRVQTGK